MDDKTLRERLEKIEGNITKYTKSELLTASLLLVDDIIKELEKDSIDPIETFYYIHQKATKAKIVLIGLAIKEKLLKDII